MRVVRPDILMNQAVATQPHSNMKHAANPMQRKNRIRNNKVSRLGLAETRPAQNAQKNYDRYLALARAEALGGDSIAAENYLQHAEHYLRSMHEKRPATARPAGQ